MRLRRFLGWIFVLLGFSFLLIKPLYNFTGFVVFKSALEVSSLYLHFSGLIFVMVGVFLILHKRKVV